MKRVMVILLMFIAFPTVNFATTEEENSSIPMIEAGMSETTKTTESSQNISTLEKQEDKQPTKPESSTEEESGVLTIGYVNESNIKTVKGEKGTITGPQLYEGVQVEWVFEEVTDNPYIRLDQKGEWTALKEGTTSLLPRLRMSEKSMKEVEEKCPDDTISYTMQQQHLLVNISTEGGEREFVDITPHFSTPKRTVTVGETGKILISPLYGVEVKGAFKEIKDNEYIELLADGMWRALKSGETHIVPIFDISKESMEQIGTSYLKQEGKENFTTDQLEFVTRKIAQIIPFTIVKQTTVTTDPAIPKSDTSVPTIQKNLPQTNDTPSFFLSFVGLILLSIIVRYLYKEKILMSQ